MRQPAQEIILEKDFERIPHLREELEMADTSEYAEYPTEEQVEEVLKQEVVSVDIETTCGLDPTNPLNEVMCIGSTDKVGKAVVVGGSHKQTLDWLERAAVDDSITVVGQNWMQFDAWFIYKQRGIDPPLRCWDTRLAAHLDNPDTPNKLSYIVAEYAVPRMPGFWKTEQNYQDRKPYVCMLDVDATLRAYHGQLDRLAKRFQVKEYWNEVFPAMQCAFDMRRDGMRVDLDALGTARTSLQDELVVGRASLPDWGGVGTENQHEQVHKYLYETLRLPIQINADGNVSAGKEQLQELLGLINEEHKTVEHLTTEEVSESVRFIELLQFLKGRSKLLTFYDPDKVPEDGRFHPQWNPAGTATFRFTANDPNAQQVPKCKCKPACHGLNPECKNARYPFIPDHPDWELMGVDLAQAEVVGFLWYAQQWKVLDDVLNHGLDAHQVMADALGIERGSAKNTSFGVIYGEDERTTAARTHKPLIDIQEMRAAYFRMFPGVPEFRSYFIRQAMNHGYVESCFGRRRYIKVRRPVGRAANQAANAPVQNIPPMVVRRAMSLLRSQLPEPARLWANVHDEVILCYPKELRDLTIEAVRGILGAPVPEMPAPELGMAGGLKFNLDIEVGDSWGTLAPIA
jgi:DNA polymerase-1